MFTKTLLGNAIGIVWLFRGPVVVAMLFAVFVAAPERVALAKENGPGAAKSKSVLDSVSRIVGKEPTYLRKPRYALVVLGTNADTKMWMVEVGETLYFDKNLNGDLTDDGPPIARKTSEDFCDYKVKEITPVKGPKHTEFCLRRWESGKEGDQYGLSLTLNGRYATAAGDKPDQSSRAGQGGEVACVTEVLSKTVARYVLAQNVSSSHHWRRRETRQLTTVVRRPSATWSRACHKQSGTGFSVPFCVLQKVVKSVG